MRLEHYIQNLQKAFPIKISHVLSVERKISLNKLPLCSIFFGHSGFKLEA